MKKSLFCAVLSAAALLVSCGGDGGAKYDETVLADGQYQYYKVAGNVTVGGKNVDWDFLEGKPDGDPSIMKAASIKDVSAISTEVADLLVARGVSAIYVLEHVEFGKNSGGSWETNYLDAEGAAKTGTGNHCFKVCPMKSTDVPNEETGETVTTWSRAAHIPSPETYAECLTPKTVYWGPKGETKDAAGNDHNFNPYVYGEKATIIAAKYKKVTNDYVYGVAVVNE